LSGRPIISALDDQSLSYCTEHPKVTSPWLPLQSVAANFDTLSGDWGLYGILESPYICMLHSCLIDLTDNSSSNDLDPVKGMKVKMIQITLVLLFFFRTI